MTDDLIKQLAREGAVSTLRDLRRRAEEIYSIFPELRPQPQKPIIIAPEDFGNAEQSGALAGRTDRFPAKMPAAKEARIMGGPQLTAPARKYRRRRTTKGRRLNLSPQEIERRREWMRKMSLRWWRRRKKAARKAKKSTKKRRLSAAGRRRISEASKRRWAKYRAERREG